jgi:hypothetical protein
MKVSFAWLKNFTTFKDLARLSTSRAPMKGTFGLLPTLATIGTLFLVAGGITAALAAWSFVGATAASLLPTFLVAAASYSAITFLNFWFSREITHFKQSSRDLTNESVYNQDNPVHLGNLVNHARYELWFRSPELRKRYPEFKNMPAPRLCTYADDSKFNIISVKGRNPSHSGLYFSSGSFLLRNGMNQKHLLTLIEMELHQIYSYRGISGTIIQAMTDLVAMAELHKHLPGIYNQFVGLFEWPLRFVSILAFAVKRSYVYDAFRFVISGGHLLDAMRAQDFKVCSTQAYVPTDQEIFAARNRNKRTPYPANGFLAFIIKPIADWIDNNELASDDKSGWRIFSFFDICVRELGFSIFKEIFSDEPRVTRLKDEGRQFKIKRPDNTDLSYDTIGSNPKYTTQQDIEFLLAHEKAIQAEINFPETVVLKEADTATNTPAHIIPVRYDCVTINGDGTNKPLFTQAIEGILGHYEKITTNLVYRLGKLENFLSNFHVLQEVPSYPKPVTPGLSTQSQVAATTTAPMPLPAEVTTLQLRH